MKDYYNFSKDKFEKNKKDKKSKSDSKSKSKKADKKDTIHLKSVTVPKKGGCPFCP